MTSVISGGGGQLGGGTPDPYDLLPYTEHAYAESSPDHLRVVAALAGFTPAMELPALAPRVLELGCGRGGNLLPLAAAWPDATFVGVDRSPSQIRDATRVAEAAELRNVTFVTADFAESDLGAVTSPPFDFVLCHGVYSWVPPASRAALLARIRAALAERGLAYVSFNTLPGWYRRFAARDFLRFAAGGAGMGGAGGPRKALAWLTDVVSPELGAYRDDLRAVLDRLSRTEAAYLTHEYLADVHHPVYAATFVEEAAEAGLRYVADALPGEAALETLPDAVQARAKSLDVGRALTLVDFARDTAFRRAVLARADTAARADFRPHASVASHAVAILGLRVASRLRPLGDAGLSDVESFEGGGVTVQLSGVTRRALRALATARPRSIPCRELADAVSTAPETLARALAELWVTCPGLDLHEREPELVTTVSPHPRASAVARWHAIEGGPVTNVWHQEVALAEPVVRFILGRLDGKATVDDVVRSVCEREGAKVSRAEARALVDASLELLARSALLVG
jgi:SAM-dependent methyltransferase